MSKPSDKAPASKPQQAKGLDRRRLFLMGGSAAYGLGGLWPHIQREYAVLKNAETIDAYLERDLAPQFPGRRVEVINAAINSFQVRGERNDWIDDFVESIQGQCIYGSKNGMGEAPRRGELQRKVFAGAQAGVDVEHDRQRQFGFLVENCNLLRYPWRCRRPNL